MNNNHTPGPWGSGKLGNDADQWAINDESGRTIGLSYHGEANARIIAASPELLAVLQEIIEMDPDGLPPTLRLRGQIAIAKAEGG